MLDCIIAPSEFMRQTLLRKLPRSRIDVIVNGIDASTTVPGDTAGDYFLYIGRLSREKGVATLALAQQNAAVHAAENRRRWPSRQRPARPL